MIEFLSTSANSVVTQKGEDKGIPPSSIWRELNLQPVSGRILYSATHHIDKNKLTTSPMEHHVLVSFYRFLHL